MPMTFDFDPQTLLLAAIALVLFGILIVLLLTFFTSKKKTMYDIIPPKNTVPPPAEAKIMSSSEVPTEFPDAATLPTGTIAETVTDSGTVVISEPAPMEEAPIVAPLSAVIPPQEILPFIKQLAKDFETKLKYDASKQELIDKLYKENMEFKEGIVKKFQQAMILAVIERIDDAAKDIAVFENREFSAENYSKLLASYGDITAGFQDMLSVRFDVECYSGEPLARFDPKTQRSLKTCPTDDADKNKFVKQTLRPGYKTAEGLILRPELVEVYVFEE